MGSRLVALYWKSSCLLSLGVSLPWEGLLSRVSKTPRGQGIRIQKIKTWVNVPGRNQSQQPTTDQAHFVGKAVTG